MLARDDQLEPPGDWFVWLAMAGRGWGKTRTGAEWVADKGRENPGARIALVGPTQADARDTMVEGESGLLSCLTSSELRGGSLDSAWNRSNLELYLANGTRYKCFSSEKPDRLRGPQHHFAWGDEIAAWDDAHRGDALYTTWSNMVIGCRLGDDPRIMVTTTPKPVLLLVGDFERPGLAKRPSTHVTSGRTHDNLPNLARTYYDQVVAPYEGTRLAAQELEGELLEQIAGALWWPEIIRQGKPDLGELTRIVVGVDPQAADEDADDATAETGIVVAGYSQTTGYGYVLEDRTVKGSPAAWGQAVVSAYRNAYHGVGCDLIVPEKNNGGAMVAHTIRTIDANAPIKPVWASVGKRTRAEPVSALYEQGRIFHVQHFAQLESQMTTWVPDMGMASPDRLDALVWALTELMVNRTGASQHAAYGAVTRPVVQRGDMTLIGERYVDKR